MLYTCSNPVLEILTVGRFGWKARTLSVAPRPFCALAFRLKGSGKLYCGNKAYTIEPGNVLYMPQGLAYSHDYTDTDLLLFHFVCSKNDPEPEVYKLKHTELIQRQFETAREVWEEKPPGYVGKCMSLLYKVLSLLAENEAQSRLPEHFLRALEQINNRFYHSGLRIGDVCADACISQTVFRQLFKKHFGITPIEYLTDLRLEQARSLIYGGIPVEQAAEQSGFSDAKYFSRVVKQRLGCTPRQLKTFGN